LSAAAVPVPDDFEPLAKMTELADGALLEVRKANGETVCLYNRGGEIGAVFNICTHAEFLMSDGMLHGGPGGRCSIECVWHGAQFDCRTGEVLKGPATDPLPVYQVRIEDGVIYVGPRK
jgi:3-phenylpropionate/trans-cinnamate dioxygenase ferredoxin subunit